jgi:glycogen debranching enzyme
MPLYRPVISLFPSSIPVLLLMLGSAALMAQTAVPPLNTIAPLPLETSGPVLRENAQPQKPFTVAGERGVLLGQQDGTFEAWVLPVKLLSNLRIEADVQGYPVPIDVNAQAAQIEVRPDRTTITYAHIAFTVRQIMFSPNSAPPGTGPVALFEFDCLHPTNFTLRFTPELRWMWPQRNDGVPGIEWVEQGGFYVLHTDYPDFAAAVAIPGAQPGILAPYQERPQVHPVEFKLHIEPARDRGRIYPLLMAIGTTRENATDEALEQSLAHLDAAIPALYAHHAESYSKLLNNSTSIETPDKQLNAAFQWSVVSIEQLKTLAQPTGETALVAGYYVSGDSARPGFGWFFGRDALYTLYAVNGFGDFALTRDELQFLIRRQRADGKIMHEYSQTAPNVDWLQFPYMYAAADSTPLFLLAVADYVRASGDTTFLMQYQAAIEKAWSFETDPAHDTDHDGIYDNSQGTGWVESWPNGMPHQEIYLALLDQQASSAMAYLESLLHKDDRSKAAALRAERVAKTINTEYYDAQKTCYAFSRNLDGSLDRTRTVYPALAWWDPSNGQPILTHAAECLRQFAKATLNTDWGLRDVSNDEPIYNGMSYHQGSVWPLFTGWASLAEYRGNQPLAGYRLLTENARMTWLEDLGADTELLSGDFYVPMGRSTSHQLWSSAMVVTPVLRGLFGISVDARDKTISVNPHLPPTWSHATVKNVHVGDKVVNLIFTQAGDSTTISLEGPDAASVRLRSTAMGHRDDQAHRISIALPFVQVIPLAGNPLLGERTQLARIVSEEYTARSLKLMVEAPAESSIPISLIVRAPLTKLHVTGGDLSSPDRAESNKGNDSSATLTVHLPAGNGWQTTSVEVDW